MSTRGGNRRTQSAGRGGPAFTLVELVLVMVILGLLAGLAAPRYAGYLARHRAAAAARRVATDLTLAQRRARLTSSAQTVTVDVSADTYTLAGLADPDHQEQGYVVRLGDEPYGAVIVSADFGGDAQVVFDGYGVPDSAGSVVVQVGSYQRTVTINNETIEILPPGSHPFQQVP